MLKFTRSDIALTLLISGFLAAPLQAAPPIPDKPTPAPVTIGSQFSISLDLLGSSLISSPFLSSPSFGAGGSVFVDWRPIQYLSFGVGAQYVTCFGNPSFQLASIDAGGRVFPLRWGATPGGEFYLQGGVGLNPLVQPPARGHFHGYAGLGYRKFLGGSMALDFGGQYDFYSPIGSASHGAAVKLGLTFLFGRDDWTPAEKEGAEEKVRSRQRLEWATYEKGSPFYTWQAGDDLKKVAARVFGNENLFSLLVDANKDLFLHPALLRSGIQIRVPEMPRSDEALSLAVDRSLNSHEYQKILTASERFNYEPDKNWKGPSNYRWRKYDTLPSVAQKLYGDEDLYPLLVNANEGRLILPANLTSGMVLRVPAPPADPKWVESIHHMAWEQGYYLHWKNVSRESGAEDSE